MPATSHTDNPGGYAPSRTVGRRARSAICLFGLVGLLGSACSSGSSNGTGPSTAASSGTGSATPRTGGTAIVAMSGDPTGVNPDISTADSAQRIGCMVYQGLTKANAKNVVQPMLAKSWNVSSDGRTYTFHLVDANWTDGKPFTSADVKYTLERVSAKYSAIFSTAAKRVDSIKTPDAHTVVIHTTVPYGPLLISLGCGQGAAILPKHLFEGTNPTKNPASVDKPVGTGPFKLQKIDHGQDVVMVKNKNYWQAGRPYLDQVVYKEIADPAAMVLALRSQEVDLVTGTYLPAQNIPSIQNDSSLTLHQVGGSPQDDLLFFNVKRPTTGDVAVRRALLMATDRQYLLKNVFFNVGDVGRSSIDQSIKWAYDPQVDYAKMYPYNPGRAKSMLDAAGYKADSSGRRFHLDLLVDASEGPLVSLAQALQAMWKDVGVDVKIEALETNTFIDRVYTHSDFDVHLEALQSYGDPALGLARQYVSSSITHQPYTNSSQYSNPQVDKLFSEAESSVDTSQRAKYYYQVQKILARDIPTVSMHSYTAVDASSARLQDLWGDDQLYWTNAWLSQ